MDEERLSQLEARVGKLEDAFSMQASTNEAIRADLAKLVDNTAALVELWQQGEAAFRFFDKLASGLRRLMKWVLAPLLIYYAVTHTSELPAWLRWMTGRG